MIFNKFFWVLSFIYLSLTNVHASTEVVGGIDDKIADYYAWFLNLGDPATAAVVSFCTYLGDDVSFSERRLAKAVEDSFSKWSKYATGVKLKSSQVFSLTTNYIGTCDGRDVDLKVLAGMRTGDPQFDNIRKNLNRFHNPAAFALLDEYDPVKSWGKGSIWIHAGNPFHLDMTTHHLYWSKPHALEAIVMHEVGHIFGNGHVAGTIMDEDFLFELWTSQLKTIPEDVRHLYGHYIANHIDQKNHLVFKYDPRSMKDLWVEISPEVIALISGQRPRRPVIGQARISWAGYGKSQEPSHWQFDIAWNDGGQRGSLKLKSAQVLRTSNQLNNVFVRYLSKKSHTPGENTGITLAKVVQESFAILGYAPDYPSLGSALIVVNGSTAKSDQEETKSRFLSIDFSQASEDKRMGRFGIRSLNFARETKLSNGKDGWLILE